MLWLGLITWFPSGLLLTLLRLAKLNPLFFGFGGVCGCVNGKGCSCFTSSSVSLAMAVVLLLSAFELVGCCCCCCG